MCSKGIYILFMLKVIIKKWAVKTNKKLIKNIFNAYVLF